MHPTHARRSGFTLIELLVVISIIGLLIAMLLPALGQARATARRVLCMTNVRAQAQAVHLYEQEYQALPIHYLGGNYLTQVSLLKTRMLPEQPTIYPTVAGSMAAKAFMCPDGLGRIESWDPASTALWRHDTFRNGVSGNTIAQIGGDPRQLVQNAEGLRVYTEYGFNGTHPVYGSNNNVLFADSGDTTLRRRIDDATDPGNTWLSFDASYPDIAYTSTVFRHLGTASFAYADGHAESHAPAQLDGGSGFWGAKVPNDRRKALKQ